MKNSKWMRFLLITLSVVMVLSLFACGNGSTEEETTVDNTNEETTVEDTTVEDTTVEDTTVEDTTVEDTTVEDTTVEDTTVEDTTAEETTVPEPVFEGNWHASVDELQYCTNSDFSDIVKVTMANTDSSVGTTILDAAGTPYSAFTARFVTISAGWIAVDGYDVAALNWKVYAADGTLLTTVAANLYEAEVGVVEHVANNMGYGEGTVSKRVMVPGGELAIVDLVAYAETTVTVVYEATLVVADETAINTVELIKIDITVPAAPVEPEETTAEGYVNGAALNTGVVVEQLDSKMNDDGSVTVTSKGGTDNNIQLMAFAPATAPKYAVIKYKTSNSNKFELFVTTKSGSVGPNIPVALTADGKWHVVVISLADCTACTVGEAITFLRLDCCETGSTSESLTLDYIWFLDDLSVIEEPVKYNVASKNNVDFLYANGNEDENLKASAAIEATTVQYVGWLGVAKSSASAISYVVTDANGVETAVALEASEEATNRYYAGGDDIQNAVAPLGDGTVGYIVKFTADLSEWAGQTVTLSIAVTTPSGVVGETFSVVVTVPAAQ